MEHQELFGREILEFYSYNDLLVVTSDQFESRKSPTPLRLQATPPTVPAPPKTDDEIAHASLAGIPQSTEKDTKYCINTWEEWRKHRQEVSSTHIPPLTTMNVPLVDTLHSGSQEKEWGPYPPNTLHHIVVRIMSHLRCSGRDIDILKDTEYREFRASLDPEMKRLRSCGIGSQK